MGQTGTANYNLANQYLVSLALILAVSISCYFSVELIGYKVVALLLLLAVSVLAMLFDILPVLVSAILSALVWNFFFIPPILTFAIGTAEDTLLFLMYFVVATINAVLTFKIRSFRIKAREKEEKENAIRLYNTLLNSLSHELRTPISMIIGAIDALQENEERLSDTHRKTLLDEIEVAAFRLNRQVENLLSMSRIEAGVLKPNPDWCDVNELVHAVIRDNKDDAGKHTVLFGANDALPLYMVDRGILEHILHNLLHNALQHTPSGTHVRLDVTQTGNGLRFTIEDDGPGIPAKDLDMVFDKFFRLPQSLAGGTGLGLSIAKGFTEALGGTVQLENRPEGGARFTVSLPAAHLSIQDT